MENRFKISESYLQQSHEAMQEVYALLQRYREETGRQMLACTHVYGCQQNVADMELLRGMLAEMGYGFTEQEEQADLIIMNTCAVREGAEYRIYGNLGALKRYKEKNKELRLVLCGCMMQEPHVLDYIRRSFPYVDVVFGTHNLVHFPCLLLENMQRRKRVIEVLEDADKIAEGFPVKRDNPYSASVTIMSGCNNFCSYCIVPYTRGREKSRTPEHILAEVRGLAANGCKEIRLIGQNVNSYGKDLDCGMTFAQLLREINGVAGIERIQFITSHPKDLSDELIDAMAECEHVCRSLHLPFQAGNNRILKEMNRKYTKEQYLELVHKIKTKMPDITLTTDVIVGFPGETKEEFADTLDVIRQVEFDGVFSFLYSKRKGTPAAEKPDKVDKQEKQENFNQLLKVQEEIGYRRNQIYVGQVCDVLVEGPSKNDPNMMSGRSFHGKIVHFPGTADLTGQIIPIKIQHAKTFYLVGETI